MSEQPATPSSLPPVSASMLEHLAPIKDGAIVRGPYRPEFMQAEVLAQLFEDTAARTPQQPALIFNDITLTYGQLNQAAEHIAQCLLARGIHAGQIVGLWLPRGLELLIAQLGIAKSGAAWLPFDADTPPDRIQVCLDDAQASGLITIQDQLAVLAGITVPVLPIEQLFAEEITQPVTRPPISADQPAYVIYTSGSTGKPKGICINQGSICHFLRSENAVLGVKASDKVYQGFSVAFDMSFEEIWISYLVGATLWIAPRAIVSDPDALTTALKAHHITVLHAVPTLLALFPEDVPNLRIINLGGEMCPDSLVDRWALPHHQMFNTYGPTEATVSASLAQLQRGEPVNIGKPLPNYGLLVINEQLQLLPVGATGELCIFGPGVAAGYLGRPDLTAEKFIHNPWAERPDETRLYKTGDLAFLDEHGQIHCLGRADDQIKIRGFRVELGEIEAALCDIEGVGTAAVVVRQEDGMDQLVAFIVPEEGQHTVITSQHLRQILRQRLPPYMVPTRFEVVGEVPRLLSGKIDRKALRVLPLSVTNEVLEEDTPESAAEMALFAVLKQLFPNVPIHLNDDFFDDLGGHSLLAARLVSGIRKTQAYESITINDVYQGRRVGLIAAQMDALATRIQDTTGDTWNPNPLPNRNTARILCGIAQTLMLPLLISLFILQWLAPFFTYHFLTGSPNDKLSVAIVSALGVFLAAQTLGFIISMLGHRLLVHGLKAGRYPLWGTVYFRWWLSDRLSQLAPVYLLSGSSLLNLYLRGMGAKIGHDVQIGSAIVRMPSLVTIGDGVSIGNAVNFENAHVERGELVIGPISIAEDGYVGSYCVLENDVHIAKHARLEGLSALPAFHQMAEGELWNGSPAHKIGMVDLNALPARAPLSATRQMTEYFGYAFGAALVSCLFFLPIFPTFIMVDWLDGYLFNTPDDNVLTFQLTMHYFLLAIPASVVMIVLTALLCALIRWTILPRLKPGLFAVHSGVYYRKWFTNQIQEASLQILHGVYATVYAPSWYRLLGAKIGKNAEISTAMGVVPDMLTLGDESFIADAVMLGDEEIVRGWMTLEYTVIGERSFVGNGAYIPDGSKIPDGVLIGVQSQMPAHAINEGETWFGSPPIRLPARESAKNFGEKMTFSPPVSRRIMRGLIEGLRIVLPLALTIGVGYALVLRVINVQDESGWQTALMSLGLYGLYYGLGCFIFILLLKWTLIRRYRPRAVPMWSLFVWLSEAVTSLYEAIAVPNFMNYLRGTPMLPWMFRLLGAHIGKRAYLDTTDMTEFDCVHIGDDVEMNGVSGPQTHLFEDRIMKIGQVVIGDRVTISARTIILYDAAVGTDSYLGPLTLVMKGEQLPERSAWCGSPAVPWRPRKQSVNE